MTFYKTASVRCATLVFGTVVLFSMPQSAFAYHKQSVVNMAMNGDMRRLVHRLESGGSPNESDENGQPPLLIAVMTDQFRMAEFLISHGADVRAASDSGWSVCYATQTSTVEPGVEADARERVIAQLRAQGLSFPCRTPAEIRSMISAGTWPVVKNRISSQF